MKIKCYCAESKDQPLVPFEYEAKGLGRLDVEIKIEYCGICHSDLNLIAGWMHAKFPLVPGHEIVGTITKIGSKVRSLSLDQKVGVGWQSGSCMECEYCSTGQENICKDRKATCRDQYGGFAETIRTDSRFVFPLPDGLDSQSAGPLLCGGTTVYSPLSRYVRSSMKVGIIGIGGLGHIALQFAKAMGCEVTAYSTTKDKEAEARKLGAHNFIATRDNPQQLKDVKNSLDFILSTVGANLDWASYIENLRPNGKFCIVGLSSKPMEIPGRLLIGGQRSVCGSMTGSRASIREMLEFAERNNVRPVIEVMDMADVNDALEKVRRNEARYRIVLKN